MKLLYFKKKVSSEKIENNFEIKEFTPSVLGGRYYLAGEKRNLKTTLVRFYFQLMSFGKAKILYVQDDAGELVHTSYIVPRCYKFSFLKMSDYEIGPCYTYPKYRGKGIYPSMLSFICKNIGNTQTTFYMIVDSENLASVRGIEKAGFELCGTVRRTRVLKRYLREKL